MKLISFFHTLLIAILILSACGRDDSAPSDDTASTLYLSVKIDGDTYKYIEYGTDGIYTSNDNHYFTVMCTRNGNKLSILCSEYNKNAMIPDDKIFGIVLENPGIGSKTITCKNNDNINFLNAANSLNYEITQRERENTTAGCVTTIKCATMTITLTTYSDQPNALIEGKFSGQLYEDEDANSCKSSIAHSVEGEFKLKHQN